MVSVPLLNATGSFKRPNLRLYTATKTDSESLSTASCSETLNCFGMSYCPTSQRHFYYGISGCSGLRDSDQLDSYCVSFPSCRSSFLISSQIDTCPVSNCFCCFLAISVYSVRTYLSTQSARPTVSALWTTCAYCHWLGWPPCSPRLPCPRHCRSHYHATSTRVPLER